jgi:hypothetical protein
MKPLFSVFAALVCAYLIAYTPSCAQVPAITSAVVQEVQCVAAQVEAGQTTFEDIAVACGGMLVSDVITIVTSLLASDAGDIAAKAKAIHHKASP